MMSSAMFQRVRPFSGRATLRERVPCRTRVVNVVSARLQQSIRASSLEESAPTSGALVPLAISIAVGAFGLSARNAFADEVVASSISAAAQASGISAEDAQILAASASGKGQFEEAIVALLFGIVVLLLVIVTGGVAYINIKQWLDSRQETEDRQKEGKALKVVSAGNSKDKSGGDDDDDIVPLRRANRIKKEKGKGFAAQEFTSRR